MKLFLPDPFPLVSASGTEGGLIRRTKIQLLWHVQRSIIVQSRNALLQTTKLFPTRWDQLHGSTINVAIHVFPYTIPIMQCIPSHPLDVLPTWPFRYLQLNFHELSNKLSRSRSAILIVEQSSLFCKNKALLG